MKKILITGAGSYIGVSFGNYVKKNYCESYTVDTVCMLDGSWRDMSFSGYDVVFHVAGIAHADTARANDNEKALYYKINRDLAFETAAKSKAEGVGQFIFMSSAIVYGDSAPVGKSKRITKESVPDPVGFYGDSKLQAERLILPLQGDGFDVVVLRPPMIYGKGSKGNYPLLSALARRLPVFPYVDNERSMLYVESLCEFVCLMIKNNEAGIFHPQNDSYSNTSVLVKMISLSHGKRIYLLRGFTFILKLTALMTGLVNKAFGSFSYDMSLSEYKENYRVCSLEESIERTEKSS